MRNNLPISEQGYNSWHYEVKVISRHRKSLIWVATPNFTADNLIHIDAMKSKDEKFVLGAVRHLYKLKCGVGMHIRIWWPWTVAPDRKSEWAWPIFFDWIYPNKFQKKIRKFSKIKFCFEKDFKKAFEKTIQKTFKNVDSFSTFGKNCPILSRKNVKTSFQKKNSQKIQKFKKNLFKFSKKSKTIYKHFPKKSKEFNKI